MVWVFLQISISTDFFSFFPFLADEARELKRMREIPDNINITETTNTNNDGLEEVIFDERYNDEESDDDDNGLPRNPNNRAGNDSPSEEESNEEEEVEYYNPNRMPKNSGNLNAKNLIGSKKEFGKGSRNNQRQAMSGSDSDANDDLAHI